MPFINFSWYKRNTLFKVYGTERSFTRICAEAYSEPSRTSNMELFAKIIKGYLLLTIFVKISTLDVWLGAEYASRIFRSFMNEKVCRYTNADLINSLYVHVHSKITPWKFHILNPQNSLVFYPRSLQNVCLQTIRTNRIR